MNAPNRQPASTRGRMPPNSARSLVRISNTPLLPSRRQTSTTLTATSTPIKIIDQPTGLRFLRGRASGSAPSSAGGGWFTAGSDNRMSRALEKMSLLSLRGLRKQTEAPRYPCASQGCPCGSSRGHKRKGRQSSCRPSKIRLPKRSGLREQLVDILPVNEMIDEGFQIVRTAVAIVDVVGVFPDVAAEDRDRAMHQRVLAVRCLGDFEFAVLDLQPAPSGAELADAGGGEIGLEFFQPAEVLVDLLFQPARPFVAAAVRLHPVPEMQMVVMLAGIVEHGRILSERTLDDLLEGFALEFGALHRVIAVGDVGLVMLVVVKFQRLLGHMRRKGVMGIGKIGKREGHGLMSAKWWETGSNGNPL